MPSGAATSWCITPDSFDLSRKERSAPMNHAASTQRAQFQETLPELAIRIFALRGQLYDGSGFHWSMVRQIGGLLERVNNLNAEYAETQLTLDTVLFCELVNRVENAEKAIALHEMVRNWFGIWVRPLIDAGKRNIRVAPPNDAEIWDHAKEDNFYQELNCYLQPLGFHAHSCKPVKGEPRHVTLVLAQ